MNILEVIREWQFRAKCISPTDGTNILPTRGRRPGPAFFPEGFGLQNPSADAAWPNVMAIGHNFGCDGYRNQIDAAGREDDKATWRNLRLLLADSAIPIESCFMTNWFVGLQPGNRQRGKFLLRPDSRFERECAELLLEEIRVLKPNFILLLGLEVVGCPYRIMPTVKPPWADAANWSAVDSSKLGPVALGVEILDTGVSANVVALLHPSFSPSNQRHRRAAFPVEKPEIAMIRSATVDSRSENMPHEGVSNAH